MFFPGYTFPVETGCKCSGNGRIGKAPASEVLLVFMTPGPVMSGNA